MAAAWPMTTPWRGLRHRQIASGSRPRRDRSHRSCHGRRGSRSRCPCRLLVEHEDVVARAAGEPVAAAAAVEPVVAGAAVEMPVALEPVVPTAIEHLSSPRPMPLRMSWPAPPLSTLSPPLPVEAVVETVARAVQVGRPGQDELLDVGAGERVGHAGLDRVGALVRGSRRPGRRGHRRCRCRCRVRPTSGRRPAPPSMPVVAVAALELVVGVVARRAGRCRGRR